MKALSEITVADVEAMDYNHLIALVRETNRAPGGYKTIASVIRNAFIGSDTQVLEIGTSTGVTAIEMAKLTGCHVYAIDINERSLAEAARRAEEENLQEHIQFSLGDAQNLSFHDGMFDMVFCGNVTSLIPDREKALKEYCRVLKLEGILAAVPMYYLKRPEDQLLNQVRQAIQTDVQVVDRDYWISFYNQSGLVLKFVENYSFDYIQDHVLDEFIQYILSQEFLKELQPEVFEKVREKYTEYIYLFRDNLSHMGYSILLYRNERLNKEPELFRGSLL